MKEKLPMENRVSKGLLAIQKVFFASRIDDFTQLCSIQRNACLSLYFMNEIKGFHQLDLSPLNIGKMCIEQFNYNYRARIKG